MSRFCISSGVSLAVITAALAVSAPGLASAADKAAAAPADADTLSAVVVTAAGGDKTKLKSSISVTSVDTDVVTNFSPRSEAEVLKLIPGLQASATAGPGGNANIGVRGIPVSTGGSEYVTIQEDGLPVILFGDVQFGNNDYWIRFDNNVSRVETVRGGSASTFASQGPGAVINYISKTGETKGGEVAVTSGLNFNETRLDFDYGDHITDTLRYHIGGFYKDGSGAAHIGYNAESGYQIKANVTKDLDDGKGYIRFNFKRLDDKEPTNTSMPTLASLSGGNVSGFGNLPGIDAGRYSSAGIYNQTFKVLAADGTLKTVSMEGIHPVVTSAGGEFHYNVSDTVTLTDNFRYTNMSGVFANQWTTENLTSSLLGSTIGSINGTSATQTVGSIVYAAGPNKGKVYTSPYINNGAQAYTTMKDVGNAVNDLTLNGKFAVSDDVKVTARGGWFHMVQHINMDWRINNATYSLNSSGNSVPLDLFAGANGTGAQLAANGVTGYNNQWGGCCGGRTYDLTYTDDAPYLEADTKYGKFDIDVSVRQDSVKATGSTYSPTAGANIVVTDALGSATLPTVVTSSSPGEVLNYTKKYTSWSIGALYEYDANTSVFVRSSRGGRFNADRLTYGGNYNADGSLTQKGNAISLNFLLQQEIGVKHRGEFNGIRYNAELTYFQSQLTEHNYDFTRASHNPPLDPNISNIYRSKGVEFSGSALYGDFRLVANLTVTDSTLVNLHTTPNGLPGYNYTFAPSWDNGVYAAGLIVSGEGSVYLDDQNTQKAPASDLVNAFAKYRISKNLELGVNVNNLFDRLGPFGGGAIQQKLNASQGIFDGSIPFGRTITASLRYTF
jgi:outer membrane receptor protein involved in Fe transport